MTYGMTTPTPPISCPFMPSGSLMNAARPPHPSSPTGLTDFPCDATFSTVQLTHDPPHLDLAHVEDAAPDLSIANSFCIRTIGIVQDPEVRILKMDMNGIMSDSGANTCMAGSEENLIGCHDIPPVTLGLALHSDQEPTRYQCTRMGFLPMAREDGTAHLQPFLVNSQATEFIMSPEAILQACGAFDSWRQEGFK